MGVRIPEYESYGGRTIYGEPIGLLNWMHLNRGPELSGHARIEAIDRAMAKCEELSRWSGLTWKQL